MSLRSRTGYFALPDPPGTSQTVRADISQTASSQLEATGIGMLVDLQASAAPQQVLTANLHLDLHDTKWRRKAAAGPDACNPSSSSSTIAAKSSATATGPSASCSSRPSTSALSRTVSATRAAFPSRRQPRNSASSSAMPTPASSAPSSSRSQNTFTTRQNQTIDPTNAPPCEPALANGKANRNCVRQASGRATDSDRERSCCGGHVKRPLCLLRHCNRHVVKGGGGQSSGAPAGHRQAHIRSLSHRDRWVRPQLHPVHPVC